MSGRPSVLPAGMRLVGDVRGEGDFVVLGMLEGDVQVEGTVVVEEGATVQGNVRGRAVAVRGVVVGDAVAVESVRVDAGGRVVGDLHAPRVSLIPGALFRGHVHMAEESTPVQRKGRVRARRPRVPRRVPEAQARSTVAAGVPAHPRESGVESAPDTLVEARSPTVVERPLASSSVHLSPPRPVLPALERTRARRVVREPA